MLKIVIAIIYCKNVFLYLAFLQVLNKSKCSLLKCYIVPYNSPSHQWTDYSTLDQFYGALLNSRKMLSKYSCQIRKNYKHSHKAFDIESVSKVTLDYPTCWQDGNIQGFSGSSMQPWQNIVYNQSIIQWHCCYTFVISQCP